MHIHNQPCTHSRIIRKPQVMQMTGISDSTIWRQEKEGLFPKRHRIGKRGVGWYFDEIMHWIATREIVKLKN